MTRKHQPGYLEDAQRQLGLWGRQGQARLHRASVAVGGIGGIGAISALMLAKAGVGRIAICDRDAYGVENVVEQAFATHDNIGVTKVVAAEREMRRHTRHTQIKKLVGDLSRDETCKRLIEGADILVSGVDNAVARIALGKAAAERGIPFVVAANIGWSVTHTVFLPGEFSYRAAWGDVPGISRRNGFPNMNDPRTRTAIEREWNIWVVAVAGFTPAHLRQFLARDQAYYLYAAPPANFAASLGVMDTLKCLLGAGPVFAYPQVHMFDLKSNQLWARGELQRRRRKLRSLWTKGAKAIAAEIRSWE